MRKATGRARLALPTGLAREARLPTGLVREARPLLRATASSAPPRRAVHVEGVSEVRDLIFASLTLFCASTPATSAVSQTPEFHHKQGGPVNGVFFLDNSLGWTAEDGARVRYTTDGGQSWDYGSTPENFREALRDVFFLDEDLGWAVSAAGSVLVSTDGGLSWDKANEDPAVLTDYFDQPAKLNTIHMINETPVRRSKHKEAGDPREEAGGEDDDDTAQGTASHDMP